MCVFSVNADDCISYKITPKIVVNTPNWTKKIVSSTEPMDLLHGNVVATLINDYDIISDVISVPGGYCVGLKSVEAMVGYSDFLVKIDNRHTPKSCSYDAIVNHENKHIDAYLLVIKNYKKDIYDSLYSAADTIIPIFVKNPDEINDAISKINNELQSHPNIVLTIQKIHAAEEIENKLIDQQENYYELKKCLE